MKKAAPKKPAARKASAYVTHFRRRQRQSGLRRMEVSVKASDAGLVKNIVSTLRENGPQADKLRQALQREVFPPKAKTGAEFLALMKKIAHFGDEISFERQNLDRPYFEFEDQ